MGLDIRVPPWGRIPPTMLFGRPPRDQLPPPRQPGAQFVGLGVRQGPGGRAHGRGEMGQGARLERLRLGQLSSRLGQVTRLAGIDQRDCQSRCRQRRHHGPLGAPRGFEDHQGGLQGLEARHQGGNPGVIVDHGPTRSGGPQGDIEVGFGDSDTNKTLWGRHQHA
jgi:hypothetical protein